MTLRRLALRDLGRSPLRIGLTVVAAAIGALAFVFLQSVIDLWYTGVAAAQADRLAVRHKTSITQPLPLAYLRRIAAVPGVTAITFAGWFGGQRGESQRDFFPNFYVDAQTYFEVYDEYVISPEARAAWLRDPCGAMIGRSLAERFGWRPGDRVSLRGTIYPGTWDFTVRGIFDGRAGTEDTRSMVFGYRCINERVPEQQRDQVSYFGVRVDDPARSGPVAAAIDAMFANSAAETRTESERAFRLGFVAMSGAILAAIRIVSYVILAIILLVVSNTIAMGVRERTVDLATMRAIGFRPRHVIGLVLVESAVIGVIAAALGVAAAPLVIRAFGRIVTSAMGTFPKPIVDPATLAIGAAAVIAVALVAGVIPAIQAARLPVAEGLHRTA